MPISRLRHHLRRYTRRNTSDFFIHKDLAGFLASELDFYLKNEVLHLDDLEKGGPARADGWFQLVRAIRAIGTKIVAFLAQIEEFQKRLFEKKKLVTECHYAITLDRVPETLYAEIAAKAAQREEWVKLCAIDEIERDTTQPGYSRPLKVDFLKAHRFLMVDTRHFDPEFEDRLLAEIPGLDAQTDGVLVHSENFQALIFLQTRHSQRAKCIYIDPPYNTGKDEFLYKDQYQHSSWLTMMDNRAESVLPVMTRDAIILISMGDTELTRLTQLLNAIFGEPNRVATFIWNTEGNIDNQSKIKQNHEYVLAYSPNERLLKAPPVIDPNVNKDSKLFNESIVNTIVKNGPGNPESDLTLPKGFPADFEEGEISPGLAAYPKFERAVKVKNGRFV